MGFFETKLRIGLLASALLLTGCGGTGDEEGGTTPTPVDPVNQSPTVTITAADEQIEQEKFTLNATANDTDGEISSYSWSHDASFDFISDGLSSAEASFTTPDISEDITVNFTVTVTDNDGASTSSSQAVLIKRKVTNVTITGLVTDEPIANAELEIVVGGESFQVQANDSGRYTAVLNIDESSTKKLVRVKAKGLDTLNPGVEFVSQLSSVEKLLAQAGEDKTLDSNDNFGVNITNVTTAEFALLTRDGVELSSDEDLNTALLNVDADEKIQLATLIKIVVDNPDYSLPEGVNSTLELVANEQVAKQFEEEVTEKDPEIIEKTKKEIKEDDDLVTGAKGTLEGEYIINSPRYHTNTAFHLSLMADGNGEFSANTSSAITWSESEGVYTLEFDKQVTIYQNSDAESSESLFLTGLSFIVLAENDVFRTIEITRSTERMIVDRNSASVTMTTEEDETYTTNLIYKNKSISLLAEQLLGEWVFDAYENDYDTSDDPDLPETLQFYADGTGDVGGNSSEAFTWQLNSHSLTVNYDEDGEIGQLELWFTKALSGGYQLVGLDTSFDEPSDTLTGLLIKKQAVTTTNEDVIGRWHGFIGTSQSYDLNIYSDGTTMIGLGITDWQGHLEDGQFTRKRFIYNNEVVTSCEGFDASCYLESEMIHEFISIVGNLYYIERTLNYYLPNGEISSQDGAILVYEYSKDLSYSAFTEELLENYTEFYSADGQTDRIYTEYDENGNVIYVVELEGQTYTGATFNDGVLSYDRDGEKWHFELVSSDTGSIVVCHYKDGGACNAASQITYLSKRPKVTLTANSSGNGEISPASQASFLYQKVGFEIIPGDGFVLDAIEGCDGYVEGNHYIAFAGNMDCEINATFKDKQETVGTFMIGNQDLYYASTYTVELSEDNTGSLTYEGKVDVVWTENSEGVVEITPQQVLILSEFQNIEYPEGSPIEVTVKNIASSLRLIPLPVEGSNWYELEQTIEQYKNDVFVEETKSSYKVTKTYLEQRLAITTDDIVGDWSVDLVNEQTVYNVAFNPDGTGTAHDISDLSVENFTWQVLNNSIVLDLTGSDTETFFVVKDLNVGYQLVTQGTFEDEQYTDAGIMVRRNEQAISADNFAGRHQFRDGHDTNSYWGEIQVYEDGELFFTTGTSSYQKGFEDGHLKRDAYYNTDTWELVDWCDTSEPNCEFVGGMEYTLVAVDNNRYYVERVSHFYSNNELTDSYAHLYIHDYNPSTKVDQFNEYDLNYTSLYQNDSNGITRWFITSGDYDEDQDKQYYTLKLDDAEPVNVELVDGKLELILNGQDTVIELIDNNRRNVTFCKHLKGNSCQEEDKVYLSFDAPQHTISVNSGSNGQLGITDGYQVTHGTKKYIDIIPDNGYQLDTISGCGGAVNEYGTYVTSEIFASCQIDVTFKEFIPLSTQANITDPALAMCIDSSEQENLESVTELDCRWDNYGEVTSLEGLGSFPNLNVLELGNVKVGAHADLSHLQSLNEIVLNGGGDIETVSVIDPQKITKLELIAQNISTIDLAPYSNLEYLGLRDNPLTDINLNAQNKLLHLDLQATQITDLDLHNNELIETISLNNSELTNLDIGHLTNLKDAWLFGLVNVKELDLQNKINLTSLQINSIGAKHIDFSGLSSLQTLLIGNTEFDSLDFTSLAQLRHLDIVGVDHSLITWSQLGQVSELVMGGKNVTSVDTSVLTQLRSLEIIDSNITDLSIPAGNMLEHLNLYYNKNLAGLDISALSLLRYFYLQGSSVESLDFSNNNQLLGATVWEAPLKSVSGLEFVSDKNAELGFSGLPLTDETTMYLDDLRDNQGYINLYYSVSYQVGVSIMGNGNVSDSSFLLSDNETRGISLYPDDGYEVGNIEGCNGTWHSADYYEVGPITESCEINVEFVEAIPLAEKAGITDPVLAQCANNSGYTRLEETTSLYCTWSGNGEVTSLEGLGSFPNLEAFHISELNLGGGDIDMSQYPSLKIIGIHNSGVTSLLVDDPSMITELYLTSNQLTNIDVSGYINLERLDLSQNALTTIDLSHNTSLNDLRLNNNQLAELDVSGNHDLMFLSAESNLLTFINVAHLNQLESLQVGHNQLTSLEVSQLSELRRLDAGRNMITELNVTMSPKLTQLSLWGNKLVAIDLSNNAQLTSLDLGNNQLTSLDFNTNNLIEYLGIEHNQLALVDLTELTNLHHLNAFHNLFNEIDLSNNPLLQHVYLSDNQLTNLDLTQNSMLVYLGVSGNFLESLNLTGNKNLLSLYANHNNFSHLDVSANTELEYLEVNNNQLNSIDLSENIKLTQLYLGSNQLASVNIDNNLALTFFSAEYNELTDIDTSNNSLLENLWLNNNEIAAVSGLESIVNKAAYINLWENNLSADTVSYLEVLRDSQGYTNLSF